MAKRTTVPEEEGKRVLELNKVEAAQFDPEVKENLEKAKAPKPVKIKALNKDLLRKGPYSVVDRGTNIHEFKTRREAYDKALEINEKRGFSTQVVEEIFD